MAVDKLFSLFDKVEKQKKSALLIGRYGIGKSSIVYQYAEKRSKELNRELKIWHELTENEKKEIINNPKKYYVLVDIKGSMISPENLIMPKFNNGEVEWSVPLWVKVFEKPESAGILFIDEINMTPPSLQSILFELILQRKIAETSLKSNNLLVVGAGNDLESNEYANEIPKPLLNRFLVINFDNLISIDSFIKYAIERGFDQRIIDYVMFKQSIFTKANESLKQSTTPRSLEMLSDMIKDTNDLEFIEFVAKSLLEENDAIEFVAFVENYEKLRDIDKYIKDPNKLRELKEDEKYIVVMKITDRYINDSIKIEDLIKVIDFLCNDTKEYITTIVKKVRYSDDKKYNELVNEVVKLESVMEIVEELHRFYK